MCCTRVSDTRQTDNNTVLGHRLTGNIQHTFGFTINIVDKNQNALDRMLTFQR